MVLVQVGSMVLVQVEAMVLRGLWCWYRCERAMVLVQV